MLSHVRPYCKRLCYSILSHRKVMPKRSHYNRLSHKRSSLREFCYENLSPGGLIYRRLPSTRSFYGRVFFRLFWGGYPKGDYPLGCDPTGCPMRGSPAEGKEKKKPFVLMNEQAYVDLKWLRDTGTERVADKGRAEYPAGKERVLGGAQARVLSRPGPAWAQLAGECQHPGLNR
jgi:hypothetical protein